MPDRYQDEIEEILKHIGVEEDEAPRPSRRSQPVIDDMPRNAVQEAPTSPDQPRPDRKASPLRRHVTPGRLALAGFAALVLGLALNSVGFGWLVWVGLLALGAAYLLFFVTPRSANQGKRWRGKSIESQGPSPWDRFKNWMKE